MPLSIKFTTDNAAFADGNGKEEVAHILSGIVDDIDASPEGQALGGPIKDANGNNIGKWLLTIDAEDEEEDE